MHSHWLSLLLFFSTVSKRNLPINEIGGPTSLPRDCGDETHTAKSQKIPRFCHKAIPIAISIVSSCAFVLQGLQFGCAKAQGIASNSGLDREVEM